jgi:uncharacterized protein
VIVVDTGVLVAAINRRDRFHASCADFLDEATEPLVVPAMVVTEVCYLLARPARGSSELAGVFLDALAAGSLPVEAPTPADFARVAHLVRRYADLPLDAVDAAVVATAERRPSSGIARRPSIGCLLHAADIVGRSYGLPASHRSVARAGRLQPAGGPGRAAMHAYRATERRRPACRGRRRCRASNGPVALVRPG